MTDVQRCRDELARSLGLDPETVTFVPVTRELLGRSVEPCRVEAVAAKNGLADLVVTKLEAGS
jgi:hypothetical protein